MEKNNQYQRRGGAYIWWQIKDGSSSFWFDNWIGPGNLVYTEGEKALEEELESKEFINNGHWDEAKSAEVVSKEMVII